MTRSRLTALGDKEEMAHLTGLALISRRGHRRDSDALESYRIVAGV